MCGIFGYIGKSNKASEIVFKGLKSLEYRGYDSWGEVVLTPANDLRIIKNVGKMIGDAPSVESTMALGHTRWATHGGVTIQNSHPHKDCTGRFALVHNGIIENFDEIKKKLKPGHHFSSETDSEVAVHLIEEKINLKNDFWTSLVSAYNELTGLNALVLLDKDTDKIYCVKNGSPIVIGIAKDANLIASDVSALLPYTNQVYSLEDYQGAILDKNEIKFYDLKAKKFFKPKLTTISWTAKEAERGKFSHFMLKEIFDQPKVLENILGLPNKTILDLSKKIKAAFGTYFVGCGSAAHACLYGQYLFAKVAKRHVNFGYGSEFSYLISFLKDTSLVIALSQSGETIDIIDSIDKAKQKNAKIVALVNVLGSTLYRKANYKLLLMAGPETAVASTKAFTAMIALLSLLAYGLDNKLKEARTYLQEIIKEINLILKNEKIFKDLAEKIYKKEHLFVVGRDFSYPIALESALKIKEVSYIHSEGLAAGELKHGLIALIEKGTPCIIFAPKDDSYGATISGAMELKARGAYIIGISENNRPEIFDYFVKVKDNGPLTAITQSVVSQLLAYYLARKRGCDIDKPKNLAKSVTVK